jgi:23S rRNA G2445 N2-methylase RlmL
MARIVGPRGRAVGVDADAEALGIAREAAMRAGVCAEFVRADASRLAEAETFGARISHSVAPATGARPRRPAWFLAVSETA